MRDRFITEKPEPYWPSRTKTIGTNRGGLKMKVGKHPTQKELHEILDYDPETGVFTWKRRPLHLFKESKWRKRNCKAWNTHFAGTQAGCSNGRYIVIGVKGKLCLAHRLAYIYVYGDIGDDEVDHINWDGTDNRIAYLKRVGRRGNQLNMYPTASNTSGVVGVGYDKERSLWTAHIGGKRDQKNLGRFADFDSAVKARYDAEVEWGYTEYLPESSAYQYLQELH
jgi:hypothetical protein